MDVHPGFNFDLCKRNNMLQSMNTVTPRALKTGTTIVGCIFKDGVVLGADTRSTMGALIASKNCIKIHYIAEQIYACGAGTAADTEHTSALVSSQLELHRLETRRPPRVVTAVTFFQQMLFKYQGYISAAMILGGVDSQGSLAAISYLESHYQPDMEQEQAMKLVSNAICSGILEDLGSGTTVDLTIIKAGSVKIHRDYHCPTIAKLQSNSLSYQFPKGTTKVISKRILPMSEILTLVSNRIEPNTILLDASSEEPMASISEATDDHSSVTSPSNSMDTS